MSTFERLTDRGLVRPPRWLPRNVMYETIMGSVAFGVSGDTSDMDIYGFAIPPKDDLFPHLRGEIPGFGTQHQRFEQFEAHHVVDPDALGGAGRSHDLTIYSIVKLFQLAMENNPNIIDCLFTPTTCVLHCTAVGSLVRERRRLFLHKGCWPKFKGYAYAQLHKISTKRPVGKRAALVGDHGYDVKYAYHVVRLLGEVEMILAEEDLDLQRDRERLKAIRRGDWKLVRPSLSTAEYADVSTEPLLFNVREDVGERNDLASKEPALVRELQASWEAWNAQLMQPRWPATLKGKVFPVRQ